MWRKLKRFQRNQRKLRSSSILLLLMLLVQSRESQVLLNSSYKVLSSIRSRRCLWITLVFSWWIILELTRKSRRNCCRILSARHSMWFIVSRQELNSTKLSSRWILIWSDLKRLITTMRRKSWLSSNESRSNRRKISRLISKPSWKPLSSHGISHWISRVCARKSHWDTHLWMQARSNARMSFWMEVKVVKWLIILKRCTKMTLERLLRKKRRRARIKRNEWMSDLLTENASFLELIMLLVCYSFIFVFP